VGGEGFWFLGWGAVVGAGGPKGGFMGPITPRFGTDLVGGWCWFCSFDSPLGWWCVGGVVLWVTMDPWRAPRIREFGRFATCVVSGPASMIWVGVWGALERTSAIGGLRWAYALGFRGVRNEEWIWSRSDDTRFFHRYLFVCFLPDSLQVDRGRVDQMGLFCGWFPVGGVEICCRSMCWTR